MAQDKKTGGGLFTKKEYKKTVSGKERYEKYLEKDRQKELELEGVTEEPEETEPTEETSNPKSGRARYLAMLEKERKRVEELEGYSSADDTAPSRYDELKAEAAEAQEQDGSAQDEAKEKTEAPVKKKISQGDSASNKTEEEMLRRAFLRRFICCTVMALAAVGLQFAHFHVPLTPEIFAIDFSALPELLASVAYGPIAGIAIVIVKNIIYMLARHTAYVSAVSNILLDSLFVVIAGFLYSKSVFTKKKASSSDRRRKISAKRRKNIFFSGLVSSVITSIAGYFVTTFISFRLLFRRTPTVDNNARLIEMYQASLDKLIAHFPFVSGFITEIHSVAQGTLLFYLDLTFAKLLIVTLVVMIIYPLMSDFLHYRK